MDNSNSLSLESYFDATQALDRQEIQEAENLVETIMQKAKEKNDPFIAIDEMAKLLKYIKLSGIMLAKFLYELGTAWETFDIEDDFTEVMTANLGLHRYTIRRYVSVWEMFAKNIIPVEFIESIKGKNIKDIIPIASAISHGNEIEPKIWEKLAEAPNCALVTKIVRNEVTQKEEKANAIIFLVDGSGNFIIRARGQLHKIGKLDIFNKHEDVKRAMQRIESRLSVEVLE